MLEVEAPPRRMRWLAHGIGASLAFMLIPVIYMAADRQHPFQRLSGTMVPSVVEAGGYTAVRYVVTKRIRNSAECPGTLQQEITDSKNNIMSKTVRETGPAKWEQDPNNPDQEIFYGHPVQVASTLEPGKATFRTVTFRFCNALQRFFRWPLVQSGPDIEFLILPAERS